jgi:cytochrome c peroxidase
MNYFFSALLVFALVSLFSFSGKDQDLPPEELCRNYVLENIDKITAALEQSGKTCSLKMNDKVKVQKLIQLYHQSRIAFKKIEFFIEYYSPFDSKYYINGPLVPKYEIEYGNKIFEPQGFQVIEENLFDPHKTDIAVLKKEYQLLAQKFVSLKKYYSTIIIERPNLTEALRLQVIRIMCLTLNGYDCTINKESVAECASVLEGLNTILSAHYHFMSSNRKDHIDLMLRLHDCINYTSRHPDSDSFDRLRFITKYLNPLYDHLSICFENIKPGVSQVNYGVDFSKHKVFDVNSINKQHFSLYRNDTLHQQTQAELGKLLFFDPILSGNNKRACSSCHKPELAFTDSLDKNIDFEKKSKIARNSPTLLNAAYQKLFFYDGRIFNLEEQSGAVFHNVFEMNITAEEIVRKLKTSPEYVRLFRAAYKGKVDSSLTFYAVMHSISEYIKTLDSKNSRFDKYIAGDTSQLNKNEIKGFNLFTGKALCGSCHFYPLFNGTVPPMYNENEFEVIGTPSEAGNKALDSDIGREKITRSIIHRSAFKTPTVRNIELTAPYMHNGIYNDLDKVLEFYNKGGGVGLNLKVENQTLPFDSLGLSKTELNDLKSFLLSLTDTSGTTKLPKKLPSFNNENLDKRKIGGEY